MEEFTTSIVPYYGKQRERSQFFFKKKIKNNINIKRKIKK